MDLRFFEITRSPEYLWLLAEGALMSAGLTLLSGILGFILALGLSASRLGNVPVLAQLSTAYVEFIRNTPLLVQLFFVAFGLPLLLGYQWPFWGHAILALTLNFSAYFAEILRAGYMGVGHGQIEAARALGLKPVTIFFKVTLPQAVAQTFPSLASQFIFLFLTTGVVSEIGVNDLTQAGRFIDSRTFRSFEVFITLTVIYIALSMMFKTLMVVTERYAFSWKTAR